MCIRDRRRSNHRQLDDRFFLFLLSARHKSVLSYQLTWIICFYVIICCFLLISGSFILGDDLSREFPHPFHASFRCSYVSFLKDTLDTGMTNRETNRCSFCLCSFWSIGRILSYEG